MGLSLTRRDFVKTTIVAGVAVRIGFITPETDTARAAAGGVLPDGWIGSDGKPRYRLDAIGKVTGQKTFARDFRSRDLEGWPTQQSHAFLVHAAKADRLFEGIDLSLLGSELQPDRLVLADDLERDGISLPDPASDGEVMLVAPGRTPPMLGHPVALLIYKDFARFDAAKRRLRFNDTVVRYGTNTGARLPPHYGVARYVRVQGETPDPEGRYAPHLDSTIFGKFDGDTMLWPAADANGSPTARGMAAAADIERAIATPDDEWLVVTRQYFSQSIDGSSLEADNGNAWYDPETGILRMILATQSPR